MRESFVFYASFLEAIEELDDNTKLEVFIAISNFALKGEEPQNLSNVAKAIFALIKPQVLANNKRYEDGKKGGRPKTKTSGFEKQKPVVIENEKIKKPNVNVNVNDNDNVINLQNKIPTKKEIEDYCKINAKKIDIDYFIEYYNSANWEDKNGFPVNWKQKVLTFAKNYKPKEEEKPYVYNPCL